MRVEGFNERQVKLEEVQRGDVFSHEGVFYLRGAVRSLNSELLVLCAVRLDDGYIRSDFDGSEWVTRYPHAFLQLGKPVGTEL